MENKEKEIKKNKNNEEIDNEIQKKLAKDNIIKTLGDQKLIRRAELNAICELNSEMVKLNTMFEQFFNVILMASADKLRDFFAETQSNVNKAKLENKISQSHKRKK